MLYRVISVNISKLSSQGILVLDLWLLKNLQIETLYSRFLKFLKSEKFSLWKANRYTIYFYLLHIHNSIRRIPSGANKISWITKGYVVLLKSNINCSVCWRSSRCHLYPVKVRYPRYLHGFWCPYTCMRLCKND